MITETILKNHNEALGRIQAKGLKVKTQIKAGGMDLQHNEMLVRDNAKAKGLKVNTRVKTGILTHNHNETLLHDRTKGLKVKTQVKAGGLLSFLK